MNEGKVIQNNKFNKIFWSVALFLFIIFSAVFLFSLEIVKNIFGINNQLGFLTSDLILIVFKILLYGVICLIVVSIIVVIYLSLPLSGKFVTASLLVQKKKFFPRFRATFALKIKGIPRNALKRNNPANDFNFNSCWEIVSSISQVSQEMSYWILKTKNKIQILLMVSAWSWFSREKAITKAKQNSFSLEAAFKNLYPSILFDELSIDDTNNLISLLEECNFGLETDGIPALKTNQTQIDRLINTFDSLDENCFFVIGLNQVKRGKEKKQLKKHFSDKLELEENNEDFNDAKKTGQSIVSAYAFSENEKGMHTILAALLSIWSGTNSFSVNKLGNYKGSRKNKTIKKLVIKGRVRLSNKAISSFIQIPEKPFLTEDTGRPIFEIPHNRENNTNSEIIIGNLIQNDKVLDEFSLQLENFLYNIEIVGMIGRGKTYLTATIIEQLLESLIGCLIFDLKGEYARLFANEPNVIVYTIGNPAPIGINLFQINSDIEVQNVLALISEMLVIAGMPFSPSMLNIFESALQKIILKDNQDFEEFMVCLYESSEEYANAMKTSYSRESIDAILNRLNYIFGGVNFEVFSVKSNTIDLSDLDKGYKIILDLSEYLRRGASTASIFLVCNFVLHMLSKYASQKGITNVLRYLVILEEAMYLIPKRFNLESAASLGYSEQNFIMGRSLGIGTISIYQLWDSVSSVVHSNSLTKILFRGEDIEKMKESIILEDEQLNYLPYLPDQQFIIKSKSLSGPALLRTKNFDRKPLIESEYSKIITKKFQIKGFQYIRINKSLMEIKKEVFEKKNRLDSFKSKNTAIKDIDLKNPDYKNLNKPKLTNYVDFSSNMQKNTSWEYCITYCPIRVLYNNKHSIWIKNNLCSDIYLKAKNIVELIFTNENNLPIIKILEKNPQYLYDKILTYCSKDEEEKSSNLITFCALSIILSLLSEKSNLNDKWKTSILNHFKNNLLREFNSETNVLNQ